jgi:hypothetical protein
MQCELCSRSPIAVVRSTEYSPGFTWDSLYRLLQSGRRHRSPWSNADVECFCRFLSFNLYALVLSMRISSTSLFLKSPPSHYDILRVFVCERQNTSLRRVFSNKTSNTLFRNNYNQQIALPKSQQPLHHSPENIIFLLY